MAVEHILFIKFRFHSLPKNVQRVIIDCIQNDCLINAEREKAMKFVRNKLNRLAWWIYGKMETFKNVTNLSR